MKNIFLSLYIFIILQNFIKTFYLIKVYPSSAQYNEDVTLLLTVNDSSEFNNDIIKIGTTVLQLCSAVESSKNSILCKANFNKNDIGQNVSIYINDNLQEINYIIYEEIFNEISMVYGMYYPSNYEQLINIRVNSYNKINDRTIRIKSDTSEFIDLYNCYIDRDYVEWAYCSVVIKETGLYYFYIDGVLQFYDNEEVTFLVVEHTNQIESVITVDPSSVLINDNERTITLTVNYVVNLKDSNFYLIEEELGHRVSLTNCHSEVESDTEIWCKGLIKNPGDYLIYLNGVKQEKHIYVYADSLSKSYGVTPNNFKYIGEDNEKSFQVKFNSARYHSLKKLSLIGENTNNELELIYIRTINYIFIEYKAIFKEIDTYYLYIDGEKQEDSFIAYSDEPITGKIYDIFPKKVLGRDFIDYLLVVDTNFGIETIEIYLKNGDNIYYFYDCEGDKTNSSLAYCSCLINYKGNNTFELYLGTNKQENLIIESKEFLTIIGISPKSFLANSYKKGLSLDFNKNVSEYRNSIQISNDKIHFINVNCRIIKDSYDKRLICSVKIPNPGLYYFYINGYSSEEYIVAYLIDEDSSNSKYYKNNYIVFIIFIFLLLF